MIKKAIVLAAGLGTRLRPLTCSVPKPLLPVWGEPMLKRIVEALRSLGVEDITVNCHYLHEQVEEFARGNGCRVSFEPEILGTGGVLNPLRDWLGGDDFYLVNGDIVLDTDKLSAGLFKLDGAIASALVSSVLGPRTIEVEPESGFVTCWNSPDRGVDGTFTYLGFAAVSGKILDFVEPQGFSTIVQAYEKAMMQSRFVRAVEVPDMLWTDAGTIDSYIAINDSDDGNGFADIPQLKAAASVFPAPVTFLGARGSERVFFRNCDSVAIIYDDSRRAENALYARHTRFLASHGIPVPELKAELKGEKTLVMSWCGEPGFSLDRYIKVVETLAKFNALGRCEFEEGFLNPPFDAALYRWERELFREHCLSVRYLRELPPEVEADLAKVEEMLLALPLALVHRDFQSTNILWNKDGAMAIIDYQGMRKGPAAYDLASLLYDPYIKLDDDSRQKLALLYAKTAGDDGIVEALPFAACQRLVQCLGAYGRLASVGKTEFAKYFLPALENLLSAADDAGLDALAALAEDLIAVEAGHKGGECGHE